MTRTDPPWQNRIPIAQLEPSAEPEGRSTAGIVTLMWPYSASRRSYSLLLVEPDFRLRRQRGQVRLHFTGGSAKLVARAGVKSGDQILLSLRDVQWAKDESKERTPGRGIDWALKFGERVLLQIVREGEDPISVDVDHPPASPKRQSPPAPTPQGSPPLSASVSVLGKTRPNLNGDAQAWSSPAFLKRKAPSSTPYLSSAYDPFEDESDHRETSPTKRTKFGRKSAEWRFAERTPSPVSEECMLVENQVEEEAQKQIEEENRLAAIKQQQENFLTPIPTSPTQLPDSADQLIDATREKPATEPVTERQDAGALPIDFERSEAEQAILQEPDNATELNHTISAEDDTGAKVEVSGGQNALEKSPHPSEPLERVLSANGSDERSEDSVNDSIDDGSNSEAENYAPTEVEEDDQESVERSDLEPGVYLRRKDFHDEKEDGVEAAHDGLEEIAETACSDEDTQIHRGQAEAASPEIIELSSSPLQERHGSLFDEDDEAPQSAEDKRLQASDYQQYEDGDRQQLVYEDDDELEEDDYSEDEDENLEEPFLEDEVDYEEGEAYEEDDRAANEFDEGQDYPESEGSEAGSSDSDVIMMDGPPGQVQQPVSRTHSPNQYLEEGLDEQEEERPSEEVSDDLRKPTTFGYDGAAMSSLKTAFTSEKVTEEPEMPAQASPIAATVGRSPAITNSGSAPAPVPKAQERSPNAQTEVQNEQQSQDIPRKAASERISHQHEGQLSNQASSAPAMEEQTPANKSPDFVQEIPSAMDARDALDQLEDKTKLYTPSPALEPMGNHAGIASVPHAYQDRGVLAHSARVDSEARELQTDKAGIIHTDDAPRVSLSKSASMDRKVSAPDQHMDEDVESEAGDYWSEEGGMTDRRDFSSDNEELRPSGDEEDEAIKDEMDDESYSDEADEGALSPDSAFDKTAAVKSSAVEIIDLESDEDQEFRQPSVDATAFQSREAAMLKSKTLQTPIPNDGTVVIKREDQEVSLRSQVQPEPLSELQPEKTLEIETEQRETEENYEVHIASKREIYDTYAEDAAFTDADPSESQLQPQVLNRPSPTANERLSSPKHQSAAQVELESGSAPPLDDVLEIDQDRALDSDTYEAVPARSDPTDFTHVPSQVDSALTAVESTDRQSKSVSQESLSSAVRYSPPKVQDQEELGRLSAQNTLRATAEANSEEDGVQLDKSETSVQFDDSDEPVKELSLQDLREELESRTQLLTPSTTQQDEVQDETLPTPNLTQRTSDIPGQQDSQELIEEGSDGETQRKEFTLINQNVDPLSQSVSEAPVQQTLDTTTTEPSQVEIRKAQELSINEAPELPPPATPPISRKIALIERLKEMRSESAKKRRSSGLTDTSSLGNPWFGPRRSSQVVADMESEAHIDAEEETGRDGDVSSDLERESEPDNEPALPRPTGRLSEGFARLPSSSPVLAPVSQETGFRTALSYFAPLANMRAHYNSITSVLALIIASTPIERATSGPKDFYTTLYITDPSSATPPSVTSARIFRPSKFAFPSMTIGDAILLRSFGVVSYRKKLGLLSTESSAWALFRKGEEPQIKGPPVEFGAEERGFARGLWDWWGTVDKEEFMDCVPKDKPEKKRKQGQGGKRRASVLHHELRNGTSYVDGGKGEDHGSVHELRDGTRWSDSKL